MVARVKDDIGVEKVACTLVDIGNHEGECCRELGARDGGIPDENIVAVELAPQALTQTAVVCAKAGACGGGPLLKGILHHCDHLLLVDLGEAIGVIVPCDR